MIVSRRLVVLGLILVGLAVLPAEGGRAEEEDLEGQALGIHLVRVQALVRGRLPHIAEGGPLPGNDEWAGLPPLAGRSGEEPVLPFGTCDEIIELLKDGVRPAYWDEVEGADIRSAGEETLVVRASGAVAREVAAFVAALEQHEARTFTVEVQAIRLARDEMLALRAVPGREALDSDRVAALLAAGAAEPGVSVTTGAGIAVGIFGGVQRAWLGSLSTHVAQGSAIAEPEVHVGHVGLSASVSVVPVPGREEAVVTLQGSLSRAEANRVAHLAAGSVELPTFATTDVRSIVTVPTGRWSLVDGIGEEGGQGGSYWLLRVTPHAAAPSDATEACVSMPLVPGERGAEALELAYFPVHALSHPIDHRDAWGTPLAPSQESSWRGSLWGHSSVWSEEGAVDFLREMGASALWEDPASIEVRNGILHVRQTPAMLRAVEDWLAALGAYALWTLETTVQVVDLPETRAREVGSGGALTREQVVVLRDALASGEATRTAVARVLSLCGSRNYVDAGRRVAYVRDYEAAIACKAGILKPVVGAYLEGIEAEVSGGLSADGRSLLLEVRMQTLEASGPLRTIEVPGGGPLELPAIETFRVRTSFTAPLGVITVAGSWAEAGRRRLLLVTPRLRR